MEAVAAVILNRVNIAREKDGYWWGNNVIQVCQKPYQFSCWNRSDPNFRKIMDTDEDDLHFATAMRIARRAIAGTLKDSTGGATHYHAAGTTPYWSAGEKPLAVVGSHIFYRFV
jgi:spore germination cell wall hydrolase CwlJ-like protein